MTDKEQVAAPALNGGYGLPGRLRTYETDDDLALDEDWPPAAATGLVSLGFLKAAIRRSAVFCVLVTLAGFLIGWGFYLMFPVPYQATTSLLLTYGPHESPISAPADSTAIAQTQPVAGMAMHKLGLHEDVNSFIDSYQVTVVSNRVLLVTFTAPSASRALRGANAVATEFLRFRAGQLAQTQAQFSTLLDRQASQAEQKFRAVSTQFRRAQTQRYSRAQQSQLRVLNVEFQNAAATLGNLQQAVTGNRTYDEPATAAAIRDSRVLSPAALLPRSRVRHLLLYPAAGLVGGFAVAIAIVLIRAIVSDRPRRRDDVANALGAPVKLSTGPLRQRRLPRFLATGASAARDASIQRIAAHLGRAVPGNPQGGAALAVVAVDNPQEAALPLVSLAISRARQGQRVVLADLTSGAAAAGLLGAGDGPGVGVVRAQDVQLVVAVPAREDLTPSGPLDRSTAPQQRSGFAAAVAGACAPADLLLTLVTLDPSLGSEHLPTWAADAVVVVTAGRSSWEKINAVGEMVRLSGTRLVSAVLIGADKTDESLGVVTTPAGGETGLVAQAPDGDGPRLAASESQGRSRSATGDIPG